MHGKIVKYEQSDTFRTEIEGIPSKCTPHITYIPATVFPWQRTPATRDALHVVVLECLQSISRDSFP